MAAGLSGGFLYWIQNRSKRTASKKHTIPAPPKKAILCLTNFLGG